MNFSPSLSVLGALLLFSCHSAFADSLKIERLIQLPDGKPAVGAKVLIRSLNPKDGVLQQEKRVEVGADGIVRADIEVLPIPGIDPFATTGYLVVDMPGMALAFEKFSDLRPLKDNPQPLRLGAGYEIKGRILSEKGDALPGAEVMLAGFMSMMDGRWPINWPSAKLVLPEAKTTTGADGSFQLRPVDIIGEHMAMGLSQ